MVRIKVFVRVKGCMRPATKVWADVLPPICVLHFLNAVVLLSTVVLKKIGPNSSCLLAAICWTDRTSWHRSVYSCDVQRRRSAGAEGDPLQRPVKRPAVQMHLDLLFESTVMSHFHPRVVNRTVEPDNSINPAMRANRSLVLFLAITPFHNCLRGKLGEAVIASRYIARE